MDFAAGTLVCEICHAEVVDNENAESVLGSKDRMQRFNHQMRFIRDGLQKSEAMTLPAYVAPPSALLTLYSIVVQFRRCCLDQEQSYRFGEAESVTGWVRLEGCWFGSK